MSENITDLTYTDRAAAADHAALSARLKHDASQLAMFKVETRALAAHFVSAGKLGRALGQSFQEYYLPPRAESAEVYFNEHYAVPLRLNFTQFKWIIAISRKLPDNPDCMQDVMPALQLTLFAAELIALPERTEEQTSHETTPYSLFFNSLRGLQVKLDKWIPEIGSWDEQTQINIREEIERMEQWLADVKKKL